MRQIYTILLDSVRMLLAHKLFWVSLLISTLIGLVYLSIGLDEKGYSIGFGLYKTESPFFNNATPEGEWFYLELFRNYITRFWIGSGSILLALISTVSVFPEFTREGAIEVSLSKPVSRLKLFLTKYVGCLLFVLIQMTIFTILIFVALKVRLNYENWSVFYVIPVITFAYSLIHCVQVLVGIMSRSSLIALLVGICFWMCIWGIQISEDLSYKFGYAMPAEKIEPDWTRGGFKKVEEPDENSFFRSTYDTLDVMTKPLPKIREVTISLTSLVKFKNTNSYLEHVDLSTSMENGSIELKQPRIEKRTRTRHSMSYFYLTSLAFEIVILGAALWVFLRKDY